jgi:hypothetical protein
MCERCHDNKEQPYMPVYHSKVIALHSKRMLDVKIIERGCTVDEIHSQFNVWSYWHNFKNRICPAECMRNTNPLHPKAAAVKSSTSFLCCFWYLCVFMSMYTVWNTAHILRHISLVNVWISKLNNSVKFMNKQFNCITFGILTTVNTEIMVLCVMTQCSSVDWQLPYILESNAHPVFGDFLNEKKFVRDSNAHLSFNHPLPTGRLIE